MENVDPNPYNNANQNDPLPSEISSGIEPDAYPPKPYLEEKKPRLNVWLRSLGSLALYLAIGFLFFSDRIWILIIITVIVVIHEMGHFLAMKFYDYKDLGIFFIPLLGAYASGTKHEVSQKQSAIIVLAGPIPGIVIGIILFLISREVTDYRVYETARLFIFLNLLNLLPIYPLDGGQLLNRLFLDENKVISNVFVVLSAAALTWFALNMNPPFYPLLLFPVLMLLRMRSELQFSKLIRKIESEGVNLDTTYDTISDEEYWQIRKALIKHDPQLSDVDPGPPYKYASKEDQVITTMQGILQRTLLIDVPLAGKLIILVGWIGCFLAPFLLEIPLDYFRFYTR